MNTTMPFDYHSHNRRCGHASGELSDYIDAALVQGMRSFGVSDHSPAYFLPGDHPLPQTLMPRSALGGYVEEAIRLRSQYADTLEVRLGIEADFAEGYEDAYREMLDAHPFDYSLGSVHWVAGTNIFDPGRWATENPEETFREYYRLIKAAAGSGMFDILSHLTAIETYAPPLADELADELYPDVVEAVRASGCLVEVNTSGYRKMLNPDGTPGDNPFPNQKMLRYLIAAGVPLTFGADSHTPTQVGYGGARVLDLLTELGVRVDMPEPITVVRGAVWGWRTDR